MMNLSEIFDQAHGGEAMQTMARQFGLSADQTQAAVNALLPAFSMGLQKQAESADSLSSIIGMFGTGQHAEAFEVPAKAADPDMLSAGTDFMNQIFGGPQEVGRQMQKQVSQQAAAMSGVSASILQQMMPMIATIILGGLFKGSVNNGLGGLLGQAMQGGLGNIFGQAMNPPPQPKAQNPMGDLFGSFLGPVLGGMFGQQKAAPPPPPADPMSAGLDMLKGMFETGQKMQGQQMAGMQSIFDQMLKAQQK